MGQDTLSQCLSLASTPRLKQFESQGQEQDCEFTVRFSGDPDLVMSAKFQTSQDVDVAPSSKKKAGIKEKAVWKEIYHKAGLA